MNQPPPHNPHAGTAYWVPFNQVGPHPPTQGSAPPVPVTTAPTQAHLPFLVPSNVHSQTSIVATSIPTINPPQEPGAAPAISATLVKDTAPIWYRLLVKSSDSILGDVFTSGMHPWSDELSWETYSAVVEENVYEVYDRHTAHQPYFPEEERLIPEDNFSIEDIGGLATERLSTFRTKCRGEAIRLCGEERPIVDPSDAIRNHPYGLFALDPSTNANPTPPVIAQRVVLLRENLTFLHDERFGGEIPNFRHPLIYTLIFNVCYRGTSNPRDNRRSFVQGIISSQAGDPNAAFLTTIPDSMICLAAVALKCYLDHRADGEWNRTYFTHQRYFPYYNRIKAILALRRTDPAWSADFDRMLAARVARYRMGN